MKQKKQKRKMKRVLKDIQAWGCLDDEAEGVKGDTWFGDQSETGSEAKKEFVCVEAGLGGGVPMHTFSSSSSAEALW